MTAIALWNSPKQGISEDIAKSERDVTGCRMLSFPWPENRQVLRDWWLVSRVTYDSSKQWSAWCGLLVGIVWQVCLIGFRYLTSWLDHLSVKFFRTFLEKMWFIVRTILNFSWSLQSIFQFFFQIIVRQRHISCTGFWQNCLNILFASQITVLYKSLATPGIKKGGKGDDRPSPCTRCINIFFLSRKAKGSLSPMQKLWKEKESEGW